MYKYIADNEVFVAVKNDTISFRKHLNVQMKGCLTLCDQKYSYTINEGLYSSYPSDNTILARISHEDGIITANELPLITKASIMLNPAYGAVHFSDELVKFQIFDNLGRQVFTSSLKTLDVDLLQEDVYQVLLTLRTGLPVRERIVVRK